MPIYPRRIDTRSDDGLQVKPIVLLAGRHRVGMKFLVRHIANCVHCRGMHALHDEEQVPGGWG